MAQFTVIESKKQVDYACICNSECRNTYLRQPRLAARKKNSPLPHARVETRVRALLQRLPKLPIIKPGFSAEIFISLPFSKQSKRKSIKGRLRRIFWWLSASPPVTRARWPVHPPAQYVISSIYYMRQRINSTHQLNAPTQCASALLIALL